MKKLLILSLSAVVVVAVISLYGRSYLRYIQKYDSNVQTAQKAVDKYEALITELEGKEINPYTRAQLDDSKTNLANAKKELMGYKISLKYFRGRQAIEEKEYDTAREKVEELQEIGTSTAITKAKSLNSKLPTDKRIAF